MRLLIDEKQRCSCNRVQKYWIFNIVFQSSLLQKKRRRYVWIESNVALHTSLSIVKNIQKPLSWAPFPKEIRTKSAVKYNSGAKKSNKHHPVHWAPRHWQFPLVNSS